MEIVVPISVHETEMHISTLEDKVFGEIQHAYAWNAGLVQAQLD